MPVIYCFVVLPLIYSFLQKYLNLDMRQALIGLALYNSVFTAHSGAIFNYSVYGYILFVAAFWMINKRKNSGKYLGLFIVTMAVVTMTHPVPSYTLLFFLILFYFLKRFMSQNKIMSNPRLILLAFIIVFSWMTYVAVSVLIKSFDLINLLYRFTVFSPGQIQTSKGRVGVDPFFDITLIITYAGQGILVLIGLVGVLKSSLKKIEGYADTSLMLLTGVLTIALFAFVPNWGSQSLVYNYDYRLRLVPYMSILIIPSALIALKRKKEKTISNLISIRNILLFLLMSLLILSAITYLPSYVYLRTNPIVANEEIITPHEWYGLGVWGKKFMSNTSNVVGSYQGMYLRTLGAIQDFYFGTNPYFYIDFSQHVYLAFSRFNLYLPEPTWGFGNDTMSKMQYHYINSRCNKIFDSGNVWLYLTT